MEEEFEEMKEKLKYENGKFLHNEKKENEILILRAENSNLKKIIDKNERTLEEKELIIETIKKKSSSMINTNNNTIKNSFELNEGENIPSSLMFHPHNQNQIYNQNNSNIASYKSYNNIHKFKSPRNDLNYKSQKSNNKKLSNVENNAYQNSKKNIMGSRVSTKELISKRIKNKVLNMKKVLCLFFSTLSCRWKRLLRLLIIWALIAIVHSGLSLDRHMKNIHWRWRSIRQTWKPRTF